VEPTWDDRWRAIATREKQHTVGEAAQASGTGRWLLTDVQAVATRCDAKDRTSEDGVQTGMPEITITQFDDGVDNACLWIEERCVDRPFAFTCGDGAIYSESERLAELESPGKQAIRQL
jgi:hypothetical protein